MLPFSRLLQIARLPSWQASSPPFQGSSSQWRRYLFGLWFFSKLSFRRKLVGCMKICLLSHKVPPGWQIFIKNPIARVLASDEYDDGGEVKFSQTAHQDYLFQGLEPVFQRRAVSRKSRKKPEKTIYFSIFYFKESSSMIFWILSSSCFCTRSYSEALFNGAFTLK